MVKYLLFIAAILFISLQGKSQILEPTDTLALITITVTDFNILPEPGTHVKIYGVGNDHYFYGVTDSVGKYKLLMPQGKNYHIKAEKYSYLFDFGEKSIPWINGPIRMEINLQIKIDTIYLKKYTLENVVFESDNAIMKKESYAKLDAFVDTLKTNPKMKIEIAGHTQTSGNSKHNLDLSTRRAFAVRKYLIENGISAKRVTAKGYGDIDPIFEEPDEDGGMTNERTEIRIISE